MCKNSFCQDCKKKLLELADDAIVCFLTTHRKLNNIGVANLPEVFKKSFGCFVTVEVNGNLRGCIGKIESDQPLYQDIIDNATEAAFYDWRFDPITKEDLAGLKIEISLLSPPKKHKQKNNNELLKILNKEK